MLCWRFDRAVMYVGVYVCGAGGGVVAVRNELRRCAMRPPQNLNLSMHLMIIYVSRMAYPGVDSTATDQQLPPHLWWNSWISRMHTYPTKRTPKVQIKSANEYVHVVVNGPSNPARTNQSTMCTYYSSLAMGTTYNLFFLENAAIY